MTVSAIDTQGVSEIEMLRAQLAAANAKVERLQAASQRKLTFKVTPRRDDGKGGAVAVYGLGQFPVTLYKGQWDRMLTQDNVDALREFIKDSHAAGLLSVKE